jgi:hypothetical protein
MSANCRHCGREISEEKGFCPECRALAGDKKTRGLWIFSILFSIALLFLAGLMVWQGGLGSWDFSLDSLWGKPAAVINGESIPRNEFHSRLMRIKKAAERQYGKNTFAGERGEALLGALAQEVLDGMVEERLIAQEARKLRIEISKERVEDEVQRIAKDFLGAGEEFQNRPREEGFSLEELRNHIRTLLLYKTLREAKTPPGADPEVFFSVWMNQTRQKAHLILYDPGIGEKGHSFCGGGICGPGKASGGTNSASRKGGSENSQAENEAKKTALEAFQKSNPAADGVTARVTNYGCHMQVDIQKDGKVVRSYSYQRGKVFEIS